METNYQGKTRKEQNSQGVGVGGYHYFDFKYSRKVICKYLEEKNLDEKIF